MNVDILLNVFCSVTRVNRKLGCKTVGFFKNIYCFEVCSAEIHLDTRITKCSQFSILHELSRLAGGMNGFVVLGVYRSTVKKQNKEKTLLWEVDVRGECL